MLSHLGHEYAINVNCWWPGISLECRKITVIHDVNIVIAGDVWLLTNSLYAMDNGRLVSL